MSDDRPTPAGDEGADGYRLRLVAWNTFLLRPRLIPGGPPLPAVGEMAAPAVADRAAAIGRALAGAYQVAALTEVFDPIERRSVLAGWDGRPGVTGVSGPERSFPPHGPAAFASSGLFTVADGVPVTRTDQLRFETRGDRRHDADAWSNKGVLLVEVDPLGRRPGGKVEIYSTHLLFGTGLLPGRRAADPERRHQLRMQQVDELVAFVAAAHRPENLAVVVGDFNVPADDPTQGLRPDRWYLDLASRMARLGLLDAWVERGVGPGPTYGRPEDGFDDEDPDCPGRLGDDPVGPGAGGDRQRVDYLWVQSPSAEHRLDATIGRPRRRALPRPANAPDYSRLPRLSDHLAVELELVVRPVPATGRRATGSMTPVTAAATQPSTDGPVAGKPAASVFGDVTVEIGDDFVATVQIHRPPNNYFDVDLIRSLADAYQALDADDGCRAIVLGSEGKHFCAGANFSSRPAGPEPGLGDGGVDQLYTQATRLFDNRTPVVAAVQGAAIGGGLGLACSADFRVAVPEARFAANFAQLGFHQGFALTATLPPIVGQQRSWEMLYTGRRVSGEEAAAIGLCDRLAPSAELTAAAHTFAAEIAAAGPLAVAAIRETMRGDLADRVRAATVREAAEQAKLLSTADFAEGVRATAERRPPRFEGR